jgi:hypothetical protein
MTSAVTIEVGKYGSAIMLLVRLGASCATRPERVLIVNAVQKSALEQAGFLTANGSRKNSDGTKETK